MISALGTPVLVLIVALPLWAGHSLKPEQKAVLETWLRSHPTYRLATDADCGCDDDIRRLRVDGYGGEWKPIPDYHPYIVTGDFNGDGTSDFVVAVINEAKQTRKFTLLVFNGPFHLLKAAPAFVDEGLDLTMTGFFYGPPRPKPYRLLIGRFESEGEVLEPHGKTYRYIEPDE